MSDEQSAHLSAPVTIKVSSPGPVEKAEPRVAKAKPRARKPAGEKPVAVTTGTQGLRRLPEGPGPTAEPKEVAAVHAPPKVTPPRDDEHAKVQKLPVSDDGSVPAEEGWLPEQRRVEDGEGSPRWRVEDSMEPPPGFVVCVPPERGLDP